MADHLILTDTRAARLKELFIATIKTVKPDEATPEEIAAVEPAIDTAAEALVKALDILMDKP